METTIKIQPLENVEVDLANIDSINEEALRHVTLVPRLWLHALTMKADKWNAAAHILSIITTANPHIAPQLFFVTPDILGLLDSSGLQDLCRKNYTRPCLMETYRRFLEDYPDIAPCRPQVDLIAAIPPIRQLTPNDVVNLRSAGFRPAIYITDINDISRTVLPRGVGIVLNLPPRENIVLFFTIAVLSNHHFIVWRDREIESKYRAFILSLVNPSC